MSRVFGTTSDRLDASYSISLPFTIAAWVKCTTVNTQSRIAMIGTAATATNAYIFSVSAANAITANHNDGTAANATSTATTPGDGAWHLAVGSFVSLSSRNAYVDGTNKGVQGTTKGALSPSVIRIGSDLANTNPMKGLIAHVAIWGGTVSDTDIATLATVSPNMVRPDILLDYWPLQSNNANEPSYGSQGTVLTATGTTFSTDDPVINAGVIQPLFHQRKVIYVDQR